LALQPSDKLEFTGERFTPECVREIRYEHMHRYVLAGDLVRGRKVLDAACGEGYGARHLARTASQVMAVDLSPDTIAHASSRYRADNLAFQVADCCDMPFADGQFDCIVSLETLEHLQAQEQLIAEFRRVLAGDGFLLVSTPDKAVYSDSMKTDNPYHQRELYRHELEDLLAKEFPAVRLLGHRLAFHSMIWPLETAGKPEAGQRPADTTVVLHREQDGLPSRASRPHGPAVYFIALCAAEERFLPNLRHELWLYDDEAESVYRHYQHEIRKNMKAGEILQNRDREIEALQHQLQELRDRPRGAWWRRFFSGS